VLYLNILPLSIPLISQRLVALMLAAFLCMAGCGGNQEVRLDEGAQYYFGEMPADFSGSWARDYARGDNVNSVFQKAIWELGRKRERSGSSIPMASERDVSNLIPIARLAEIITRPDVLTISQSEHEILVERRDDFSLLCAFYNGVAKPTESAFGRETCGWNGDRLISVHDMPDGLRVVHRFHVADNRKELRVITTVSSSTAPMPFTISHYYWRFEKVPGKLDCIETLSMNRVCSTGKLEL